MLDRPHSTNSWWTRSLWLVSRQRDRGPWEWLVKSGWSVYPIPQIFLKSIIFMRTKLLKITIKKKHGHNLSQLIWTHIKYVSPGKVENQKSLNHPADSTGTIQVSAGNITSASSPQFSRSTMNHHGQLPPIITNHHRNHHWSAALDQWSPWITCHSSPQINL